MQHVSRGRLLRCGVALLAGGLLVAFKMYFNPLIGKENPFLLFLAGIMFSSWLGGVRLGLVSTVAYAFVSDLLFLTPGEVLHMNSFDVNFQLGLFLLEGTVISWGTSALRRTLLALEEADRRKDVFLAVLSHELRNHLSPIHYALVGMQTAPNNAPLVERAQRTLDSQVQQLTRLVDDMADMSRIRSGKLQLSLRRIDLAAVIEEAVETSRPLMARHGHELTVLVPSQSLFLEADSPRLVQLVANLLNNAAKYTKEGGHITVSAEAVQHEAHIRVRDNGVGIPTDLLPKVFDLFTQVTDTRNRSQGGLGIGLALVRKIVEMHGGTVEAFSEGPGRGSEFLVRLPLSRPQGHNHVSQAALQQ